MIAAMLVMVEVCVKVRNQSEIIQGKLHSLKGEHIFCLVFSITLV